MVWFLKPKRGDGSRPGSSEPQDATFDHSTLAKLLEANQLRVYA